MSEITTWVERDGTSEFPDSSTLPAEDGEPLESKWHYTQIHLLEDIVIQRLRNRDDFFTAGNMFIYYSAQQVRNRDYKGPDFFLVKDVGGDPLRDKWVVWEENFRYPDLIVELMSPSTETIDLGLKKDLYERTFRTPEYFCCAPHVERLYGWRLVAGRYESLVPNEQGWLWSEEVDAWLGPWQGVYRKGEATWLRLYDRDGRLIPTAAEVEHQRAEAAEAEMERLRAELARLRSQGKS